METQSANIHFSFTWQGLLHTTLIVAGIVAVIVLIVLILRLIRLIGKVDLLLDRSRASIETTIDRMPVIAKGVEEAVGDVQDVTSGISHVFHIFRKFSGK